MSRKSQVLATVLSFAAVSCVMPPGGLPGSTGTPVPAPAKSGFDPFSESFKQSLAHDTYDIADPEVFSASIELLLGQNRTSENEEIRKLSDRELGIQNESQAGLVAGPLRIKLQDGRTIVTAFTRGQLDSDAASKIANWKENGETHEICFMFHRDVDSLKSPNVPTEAMFVPCGFALMARLVARVPAIPGFKAPSEGQKELLWKLTRNTWSREFKLPGKSGMLEVGPDGQLQSADMTWVWSETFAFSFDPTPPTGRLFLNFLLNRTADFGGKGSGISSSGNSSRVGRDLPLRTIFAKTTEDGSTELLIWADSPLEKTQAEVNMSAVVIAPEIQSAKTFEEFKSAGNHSAGIDVLTGSMEINYRYLILRAHPSTPDQLEVEFHLMQPGAASMKVKYVRGVELPEVN